MSGYAIRTLRCKLVADGAAKKGAPVNTVACSDDARALVGWYYSRESLPHERLIAILLNGMHRVIGVVRLAEGGLHGCAVTEADILRPVLVAGATAFILAHNHPSGCAEASPQDVAMTETVRRAADVVGVTLLDHFVWADGACKQIEALSTEAVSAGDLEA